MGEYIHDIIRFAQGYNKKLANIVNWMERVEVNRYLLSAIPDGHITY